MERANWDICDVFKVKKKLFPRFKGSHMTPNAGLMLDHRLRRWPNINPALGVLEHCCVTAWLVHGGRLIPRLHGLTWWCLQSNSPDPGGSFFSIYSGAIRNIWVSFFLLFFPQHRFFVEFGCVFCKLAHLACNKRAVIFKIYYMPNGLTSTIHNKIPPNF